MRAIQTVTSVLLVVLVTVAAAQEHQHGTDAATLGVVDFPNSCQPAARAVFNRAVAWLHSFEFKSAIDAFNETLKADPSCAIAEWGIALSRWNNPMAAMIRPPAQLQQGRAAVDRARAVGARTERERGYIEAVARLYTDFERISQADRLAAYRDAMGALAAAYPDDTEASIFHALAITAAAAPTDKTYAAQLQAGAILEKLFAKQPNHPGLAHYIIHTYDVPALAGRAIDAAGRYSKIAPSAPHALHMPSHTFTRVGRWQQSIDANIASAAAARRAGCTSEELHASDYQAYAYLQTGQDAAVARLLQTLPEMAARFDPDAICGAAPGSGGAFALAAMPARYALERGAWADAARLEAKPSRFGYPEAMTYFARALGGARISDAATVRDAIEHLGQIRDRLTQAGEEYWAEQVEIQRVGASAWLAFAEMRHAQALDQMRAAADREDRTEKNAVSPGPLAPARELVGEMLLELKKPADALAEFEATLKREPNRFRAVAGAARAAALAGDRATARKYYDQLLQTCERADQSGRPELAEARRR